MNNTQKSLILTTILITTYFLYSIFNYWKADIYYNRSDFSNAISISPNEAIYISKLSLSNTSIETSLKALSSSPYNQNIRKILISNLVKKSEENPNNLILAEGVIKDGIVLSPNDPKLYYQLGILQLKMYGTLRDSKNNDAVLNLEKSVELKSNYKEGRFALGATYKALNENSKAKEQFEYILKYIDPNDELTKKYLGELN